MNYLKGMLLGVIVGAGIGAVIIASNTELSGQIKEKTTKAKKKISKFLSTIKDKLDECPKCECKEEDNNCNQSQTAESVQN